MGTFAFSGEDRIRSGPSLIVASWREVPQPQWSPFPTGEPAPFRLISPPTKLLPLAVVGGSSSASPESPTASPVRAPSRCKASLRSSAASGNAAPLRVCLRILFASPAALSRSHSGSAHHQPQPAGGRAAVTLSFCLRQTLRFAQGTGAPVCPSASRRALWPLRDSLSREPPGWRLPPPEREARVRTTRRLLPPRGGGVLGLTGEAQGLSSASSIETQGVSPELDGRSYLIFYMFLPAGSFIMTIRVSSYKPPPSPASSAYACRPSHAVKPPGGPDWITG